MLLKVLMCFESEAFFAKRSTSYDGLDGNMKNCIVHLEQNLLGADCSGMQREIYETFKIDEVFFRDVET